MPRLIGYWFSVFERQCPLPQSLAYRYSPEEQQGLARYLDAGGVFCQYRGYSYCRFVCGVADEEIGSADLWDGAWVWPSGLSHYVREHSVRLPNEFRDHARSAGYSCPRVAEPDPSINPSSKFWEEWGVKQGAVPDLQGWQRMELRWNKHPNAWQSPEQKFAERLLAVARQNGLGDPVFALINHDQHCVIYELHDGRLKHFSFSSFDDPPTANELQMKEYKNWSEWPRRT